MTFPYQDTPRWELSADQLKERTEWMEEEARRLVEARQSTQRPAQPVSMALPPTLTNAPTAAESRTQDMANQLTARMRERDRGDQVGRG